MLGNYEKRYFADGEKVWIGHYRDLINILHWHLECEIIRIVKGGAQIRIGEHRFHARPGDVFFCAGEELHSILSEPDTRVDIVIFSRSIVKDVTDQFALQTPAIADGRRAIQMMESVRRLRSEKGPFYRELLENEVRGFVLDVFRGNAIQRREEKSRFYVDLIRKINDEFAYITFADAVAYSGYSPSHFSKMFKRLSGMNFSEYLNVIRVERAIALLRDGNQTMTAVSLQCGFATVRNFNRVFKEITGYSPRSLPGDYVPDTGIRISGSKDFDPTHRDSVLI